ncbi:MAG: HlyD family type I secretion periplasmic adaptor subunit [Burkholderiales bacterium]|jgi:hemolysin D|nr:HlyD family type I secretion periplasmic adaptor subunit [Burkholderiales bacterium]MCX7204818.1 HlyD family type I secretion periplasmic adaptor subunit [Pseudomonadota bacterium]
MASTNKPPVKAKAESVAIDFLPDADEIEQRQLPFYVRSTLLVLLLAFISFLLWANFSEVEQVVIAQGRLVNPSPNIVVQPFETSIIQRIDVRVGQVVHKGQRLAMLDPTFAQADDAQLRSRLQSLETQIESLQAELSGKTNSSSNSSADTLLQAQILKERQANYRSQAAKIDQNLARLSASIQSNRSEHQALSKRLKSMNEIEAMQEKAAAQQYDSKLRFLEARDRRLDVERSLGQVQNRGVELSKEVGALQAERSAFGNGWRQKVMEDLLAGTRERDSLNEQLQKSEKRRQMVTLISPVDAVVLDIAKLSQGSIIREAEQFFTLVPLGAVLEVEARIESLDIGYIKEGDPVHMKLDTFPFQKHGMLEGKVRTISEDSFRNETAPRGADNFYITRIDFGDNKLKKMTGKSRLLPGMTLSAEIVIGKRTVISYLIWPLTKAIKEAIREP